MKDLKNQFRRGMRDVYTNALRECRYNATRFIQMVEITEGLKRRKYYSIRPAFNAALLNYGNVAA